MSDETGKIDRDKYRYDNDGKLTVWGARDVLLHIVDDALRKVPDGVGVVSEVALDEVRAAYARRLDRALDDVQEAVLRCHDEFGCYVGGLGVERDEETGEDRVRFVCRACDEGREAAGYDALAQDEEYVEFNEALREARQLRRRMLTDADEVRRRIRSGVPEPRDETWDAVREVRESRDAETAAEDLGACYDGLETADQSDQADARDDRGGPMSNPIGWVSTVFQEALVVEAGDVVSVTQVIGSDGRTTSVSATVTRAAELEALDLAETGDE